MACDSTQQPTARITAFIAMFALFCCSASFAEESEFIAYPKQTFAITNAILIDGTGQPAQRNQTILLVKGRIAGIGPTPTSAIPQAATVIDAQGKTVIPGLVMMHEHMFYPTGNGNYTEMLFSFPRLYLAGGATTVRAAGTMAAYGDLNLRDAISEGKMIGPDIDVTAPYLNGPGLPIMKVNPLRGARDAKRMVEYWSDEGVTSYKAYMHISRKELATIIKLAHQRDHKVTAHLCSVTFREAAQAGIDNLEHGFFVATDFIADKAADTCPDSKAVSQSLADLDVNGPDATALIQTLIDKKVAITSTLTIFETYVKGRPRAYAGALDMLIPQLREQYESTWHRIAEGKDSNAALVFCP